MKGTLGLLALVGAAFASPMPQGVTSAIAPSAPAPAGCASSYSGTFEITVINVTHAAAKRDLEKRDALVLTLNNGILKDAQGRIGYIAANRQFQFDGPPQTGAIYTAGWSVCQNGSLALGGTAVFYQCLSGNFYNLYDETQGKQCAAIYIQVLGGSGGASSAAPAGQSASQISDGQPQASTGRPVSQISDGQPQATTKAPAVTQISDGQIQATTAKPAVSQISDGQVQATTGKGPAVTQISDGQVQATTGKGPAVTQISDGQVQATTGKGPAVTQISDGQVQATTGKGPAVTQISDGQVQATTGKGPAVTQISDGQVQATTGKGPAVTQISDGQVQATTGKGPAVTQISDGQVQATTGAAVATFTGAAAPREIGGAFAFAAGIVGAVALL